MGCIGSKESADAPKQSAEPAKEVKKEEKKPAEPAKAEAAEPAKEAAAPAEATPAAEIGKAPEAVSAAEAKPEEPATPAADDAAAVAAPAPEAAAKEDAAAPAEPAAGDAAPAKRTKIYIVYYSMYGHIHQLAEAYKAALGGVEGLDVELYQVPEILPNTALEKMGAPPKPDVPILAPSDLVNADALVFGFPTRFGMMAAQMKAFFDATGGLWQKGALHGKPVSLFTSTATQGGGQETTIMTAVTQLTHHGMIYVPTGYAAQDVMFGTTEAKGGSPWGAGTLAGPDGSRQPSAAELTSIAVQAKLFGGIAKKLTA